MDKTGRIYLSGRKKNVIVLENGKNVCPEEIEQEVMDNIPYIKECVAYEGDYEKNGKLVSNKIVVGVFIEDEGARKNIEKIKEDFRAVNKTMPAHKQVNYVNIVDKEYEKTSTKKIKRTTIDQTHNTKTGIIL